MWTQSILGAAPPRWKRNLKMLFSAQGGSARTDPCAHEDIPFGTHFSRMWLKLGNEGASKAAQLRQFLHKQTNY